MFQEVRCCFLRVPPLVLSPVSEAHTAHVTHAVTHAESLTSFKTFWPWPEVYRILFRSGLFCSVYRRRAGVLQCVLSAVLTFALCRSKSAVIDSCFH